VKRGACELSWPKCRPTAVGRRHCNSGPTIGPGTGSPVLLAGRQPAVLGIDHALLGISGSGRSTRWMRVVEVHADSLFVGITVDLSIRWELCPIGKNCGMPESTAGIPVGYVRGNCRQIGLARSGSPIDARSAQDLAHAPLRWRIHQLRPESGGCPAAVVPAPVLSTSACIQGRQIAARLPPPARAVIRRGQLAVPGRQRRWRLGELRPSACGVSAVPAQRVGHVPTGCCCLSAK
jgi:hypothetical protein